MPGVLFEGGSFRAIFSCGVMDALLDQDVMFPYCIGVSAGAADSASYISRQKERNLNMLLRYRNDKRYMGLRNYFKKEHSLFGVDFVFRYGYLSELCRRLCCVNNGCQYRQTTLFS